MKRHVLIAGLVIISSTAIALPQEDIYPIALSGKNSVELGEIIFSSMLDKGQALTWDWQSNSNIVWQDGITQSDNTEHSNRDGLARINVMGKRATVLKSRKDELGWTISLQTLNPVKFGPESIEIMPLNCFGSEYEGCEFNPIPSLKNASITFQKICSSQISGPNNSSTYLISHDGKENMLLTWDNSGGSGGTSSSVTIRRDISSVCDENDDKLLRSLSLDKIKVSKKENKQYMDKLTKTVQSSLTGFPNHDGDTCHAKLIINGFGGLVGININDKKNAIDFCYRLIDKLMKTALPKPNIPVPSILNLKVN